MSPFPLAFLHRVPILLLPFLLLCERAHAQEEKKAGIDSLRGGLQEEGRTSKKLELLLDLSEAYWDRRSLDSARSIAERALSIAEDRGSPEDRSRASYLRGKAFHLQGSYYRALKDYKEAERIRTENGIEDALLASIKNNLGVLHRQKGRYEKALESYMDALDIKKRVGADRERIADTYLNIGGLHYKVGTHDQALEYYRKALEVHREAGDSVRVSDAYNNIGLVQQSRGELDRALASFSRALRMKREHGRKKGMARTYNNLGGLYEEFHKKEGEPRADERDPSLLDSAIHFHRKALRIEKELGDPQGKTQTYWALGSSFLEKEERQRALNFFKKAAAIADSIGARPRYYRAQRKLALTYAEMGRYQEAFEHHREFSRVGDSIHSDRMSRQIAEMEEKYEAEKKLRRIEKLEKEKALSRAEDRRQWAIIHSVSGGLILVLGLLVVLLDRFRVIRRQRDLIDRQRKEVGKAYEELHRMHDDLKEKSREIGDSINYASFIQEALLPPYEERKACIGDHALFFQPQATVSGDFYWCQRYGGHTLWAAVDCTGHGVPGAFMSMIAQSLLDQAVLEKGLVDPGTILDELREGIRRKWGDTGRKDGMDIALCSRYSDAEGRSIVRFAGANEPLYLIREGVADAPPPLSFFREGEPVPEADRWRPFKDGEDGIAIQGDKQAVAHEAKGTAPFTSIAFEVRKGDRIYLFSDGFPDQFGGAKGKKFRYRSFQELLLEVAPLSSSEQEKELRQRFEEWKGDHEQVDDVLVLGVSIQAPSGPPFEQQNESS